MVKISKSIDKLKAIPDKDLGKIVKAYLEDSLYNSFDGFSKSDIKGINRLLEDLGIYTDNIDRDLLT